MEKLAYIVKHVQKIHTLIVIIVLFYIMNGCKTTEILSDIDKGLGK